MEAVGQRKDLDAKNVKQHNIKIQIAHGETMIGTVITLANTVPKAGIKTRLVEQAVNHVVGVPILVGQVQAALSVD